MTAGAGADGAVPAHPKKIVRAGYDACARRYNAQRASEPALEVRCLVDLLPAGSRVLEIGCGGGHPITALLAEQMRVVGVDISPVQIEIARRRVARASFIHGDIMDQEFAENSFDAVVGFHVLFHLPRTEHRLLLERVAGWLRPGGTLLVSVADTDGAGYTEPDFFGATMYWSHFGPGWYRSLLAEIGFELVADSVTGHGYRDEPEHVTGRATAHVTAHVTEQVTEHVAERHPVLMARRVVRNACRG